MQLSMINQPITNSSSKNMETQIEQIANLIANDDISTISIEMDLKEHCIETTINIECGEMSDIVF